MIRVSFFQRGVGTMWRGERANYERFKEAPGSKTYHVGEERDYIKREKDEKMDDSSRNLMIHDGEEGQRWSILDVPLCPAIRGTASSFIKASSFKRAAANQRHARDITLLFCEIIRHCNFLHSSGLERQASTGRFGFFIMSHTSRDGNEYIYIRSCELVCGFAVVGASVR